MLTQGNTKLGMLIWAWSIPALKSCVGASEVCKLKCYALKGYFRMFSVQKAHERNWQATRTKEFVPWIIQQIKLNFVQVLRIHVAGDFYDRRYIERWIKITQACPNTMFYAYTRSWADRKLLDALTRLGRMPNVVLYFSWDSSMDFPPKRKGVRTCYLSQHDADLPGRMTDLVFRDSPESPMKHDPVGNLVCPYDNKVTPGMSCSMCRICWTKEALQGSLNLRRRSANGSDTREVRGDDAVPGAKRSTQANKSSDSQSRTRVASSNGRQVRRRRPTKRG